MIDGLDVHRIDISYAISISFSSTSPENAARVANATAEAYLRDLIGSRAQAARVGSEWLEQRVTLLRKQMNAAARRVQGFKASQDYRVDASRNADPESLGRRTGDARELESTAITYRKIYENFYQAFTEVVQRDRIRSQMPG